MSCVQVASTWRFRFVLKRVTNGVNARDRACRNDQGFPGSNGDR